jgi:hypothetical protein
MRPTTDEKGDHVTPWGRRKKRLRAFILSNPYVPLVSFCLMALLCRTHSKGKITMKAVPFHQHYFYDRCARCGYTDTTL